MPMQAWAQLSPSELSSASPQNDESFVSRLSSLVYIYRPLLNVTRAELLDYARKNKLTWCEDESNADVKFTRNKIRHEFLPNLERECPGAIQQLCKIAGLADKAYAKVMEKCEEVFGKALQNKMVIPEQVGDDTAVENDAFQDSGGDDNATPITPHTSISLDKKKLNKILREHAKADLSELFRLWISEVGFRFPTGFFYAPKEPAHVKIPVHAVYRKRSIIKIRHTVWICEFEDARAASKFVSCEMNEKDYNEST
jgi:tRNA(Ile)-lysidine synthase